MSLHDGVSRNSFRRVFPAGRNVGSLVRRPCRGRRDRVAEFPGVSSSALHHNLLSVIGPDFRHPDNFHPYVNSRDDRIPNTKDPFFFRKNQNLTFEYCKITTKSSKIANKTSPNANFLPILKKPVFFFFDKNRCF